MKNKKILIAASIVILGVLFFAGVKIYKAEEARRLGFIVQENFKTFVPDHAPKLGPDNPEVYLVEFLDPECESCREFYPLVKMLMSEFEGKIQLVIRYAPFHENSGFAVAIIEAARKQNKYWEALEVAFQYQPYWGSHHNPRPELLWNYLPEKGIDVEQIKVDMNDPAIEKIVEQDIADGKKLGVRLTPTFFINGKPLEDFGYDQLREAIMNELKQAP